MVNFGAFQKLAEALQRLKVGGLRPPTLPGTSAMDSRRILFMFYIFQAPENSAQSLDVRNSSSDLNTV